LSPAALDPDELAHLEDQREFLLASLADLEREHDAGDLDDVDYAELRDDYTARAAETLRAIDEHRTAFAEARRPRSLKRTVLVVGGVALFALVSGVAVAASLGARKPGGVSSGGVTTKQTTSQRAQACIAKMDRTGAQPKPAINCFQAVLHDDPGNAVALTWLGWQVSLASEVAGLSPSDRVKLQGAAAAFEDRAVRADPDYSYARAFRAVIAYRNGDPAKAKQYLAEFQAHDPSADAVAVIKQMDLGSNIDILLAAEKVLGSTTTTTSTTTPG
jgi:hypothetical protein